MLQSISIARSRLPHTLKSNFSHNILTTPARRIPNLKPQSRLRNVRLHSTQPHPSPPGRSLSTSEKLKDLSRRYGYAALGVYLGLSALDFPFCFLAVRMLGPERVGEAEHYVVDGFWKIVGKAVPSMEPQPREEGVVEEVLEKEKDGASIWTQLLIAYGVHKSLIFFRVPITAAITPNIVKYLRKRGWNIGRPKTT